MFLWDLGELTCVPRIKVINVTEYHDRKLKTKVLPLTYDCTLSTRISPHLWRNMILKENEFIRYSEDGQRTAIMASF